LEIRMIADSAARLRALDVSQSFIVQAPAGSGKTELLIQRYLKLLKTVEAPDAVVAITFTRKAAGEMRSRVISALRNARRGVEPDAGHERLTFQIARDVLEHEQRLEWKLPQNPARLRIETIDALCAAITRRMPWLSRFGAMPEIVEKAQGLYREAARNALRHLEEGNEALADLVLHLDNDFQRAAQLISQMLERRDQWLRHTGASLRKDVEAALQRLILDELAQLRGTLHDDVAGEIPGASLEDLDSWRKIADLLLTKDGDLRKRVDPRFASLRANDALIERLARVLTLPPPEFGEPQWRMVEAAVSVLTLAVAELQLVFREHGCVDFAELSIRASAALGQVDAPEDLALSLGHRMQHILVDEFQDTSRTQFELIEKLTAGWEPGDGRTLFLVGDPMQSIYRFRQADVGLFLKARLEGIGAIQLEPLALGVNFRSHPKIVEWVNNTFESILPPNDDIESGAVAYSRGVAGSAAEGGQIGVHAFAQGREADGREEADRVIELIRSHNEAHGDGSVAVLVRSRAHLIEIVRALERQRIPFQAIEIDQLGERQVVEDLMALTFALLHAADRVSWLAILRAPWCGLTLADLHALAGANRDAAIWDLLHSHAPVSDDGRARIERILPVLEQALSERGRRPLRDWVEAVWLRLGGPACVENEAALEDAAAYFDLLDGLAEGADLADFEWFREQVNGLFAPPDAAAGDRLQLMTIHKAKGLEFDTVILPSLGAIPRSDDQSLLLCIEHAGELLLAPISESGRDDDLIYRYLANIERRKAEQEVARLLYVAATRARRNLHLLGSIGEKNDGTWAEPKSNSFLKLLWKAIGEHFANPVRPGDAQEGAPARTIRRVPAQWRAPEAPPAVEWDAPAIEREQRANVAFEWASDRSRFAGDALHGLLQRIAREGLDGWDEGGVHSRRATYRAVLANLGVPTADLTWAVDRVEAGLTRTLRDPRGRWCLEDHAGAASELPIAGWIDGKLCEAVIDRTFIDDSGVRWIIDYKTSEPAGADVENFLEAEKERYREQLERYARLLAQRDDRPIRLGLYFPLLGAWLEWGAGVVLRKQALLFEL
jgi:ATP-dependent exoDNAse (exonuclease V) beta subunit